MKVSPGSISVKDFESISKTSGDILLITRSFGFGQVPKETRAFLDMFKDRVKAVAVSGNKNWGRNYGKAGETIAEELGIPLVLKFEGLGYETEVNLIKNFIVERNIQNAE